KSVQEDPRLLSGGKRPTPVFQGRPQFCPFPSENVSFLMIGNRGPFELSASFRFGVHPYDVTMYVEINFKGENRSASTKAIPLKLRTAFYTGSELYPENGKFHGGGTYFVFAEEMGPEHTSNPEKVRDWLVDTS